MLHVTEEIILGFRNDVKKNADYVYERIKSEKLKKTIRAYEPTYII